MSLTSQANSGTPTQEPGFFDQKPRLLTVSIVVLFLLAGTIRLYKLEVPGLLLDREYLSAILARDFYFEHTDSVEEWRKEITHITRQNQPVLEPPVTEFLVSLIYWVAGSEQLWFARLLTSSFWLVGGIFLYKIAKRVVSKDAAVFATAYYLFAPLSILASRSFQPDALMMMMFLISLFSIIKYYDEPSMSKLITAAGISGLALLYRPLVLFTLMGAFSALALYRKGSWKGVIDRQHLLFIVLSLLPAILYYGYGVFIVGFLRWKVESSFRPLLLFYQEYWKGWLLLGVDAVGYIALIATLLGLPMLREGLSRALLFGLWLGYFVFGLVFNFHIHTHGYYHLQLIPIVAFSFGPIVTLITNHLKQTANRWYWWLPVVGALLLALLLNARDARSRLGTQVFESEQTAREIGEIVNHSGQTVYLARYYGLPLQYYGEFSGAYWPRRITYWLYRPADEPELDIEERLNALDFSPEYFIITDFKEYYAHHSDLKEYLEKSCSLLAASDEYFIYSVCPR